VAEHELWTGQARCLLSHLLGEIERLDHRQQTGDREVAAALGQIAGEDFAVPPANYRVHFTCE